MTRPTHAMTSSSSTHRSCRGEPDPAEPREFMSECGQYSFVLCHWPTVHDLAAEHGWTAMGTQLSERADWDGNYLTPDFQLVTAEDAMQLAAALERALALRAVPTLMAPRVFDFVCFCRDGAFRIL